MAYRQRPWKNDLRSKNFSHERFFGSVAKLPRTLNRPLRPIENQKDTVRCTGYGTAVAGGYINGVRMHPDWQAYTIGRIQGRSVDLNGGDPNATMKSGRDYGFLPYDLAPSWQTLASNTAENTRTFDSNLDPYAKPYRTAGFVRVDGPMDTFDNIRNALYMAYDPETKKGAPVHAFGKWYIEWNTQQTVMHGVVFAGWHHYLFVDWITVGETPYLVAHNSYGTDVGDRGYFYFPRHVVNQEFDIPGTSLKIFKPLTPEQVALAKQETPLGRIQRMIIDIWYRLSELYGA